jgi:hypothetical protein
MARPEGSASAKKKAAKPVANQLGGEIALTGSAIAYFFLTFWVRAEAAADLAALRLRTLAALEASFSLLP